MENKIGVGLGELHISCDDKDILIAHGLGSCVGVAAYDPIKKVGGLLHVMLPSVAHSMNNAKRTKFADTGIPLMIEEIEKNGGKPRNLIVKLAGGARMFRVSSSSPIFDIGDRNIESVKKTLQIMKLSVCSEDLGLNYGRTMQLYVNTGKVMVKTFGKGEKEI